MYLYYGSLNNIGTIIIIPTLNMSKEFVMHSMMHSLVDVPNDDDKADTHSSCSDRKYNTAAVSVIATNVD